MNIRYNVYEHRLIYTSPPLQPIMMQSVILVPPQRATLHMPLPKHHINTKHCAMCRRNHSRSQAILFSALCAVLSIHHIYWALRALASFFSRLLLLASAPASVSSIESHHLKLLA
jgi:hypothetical protein